MFPLRETAALHSLVHGFLKCGPLNCTPSASGNLFDAEYSDPTFATESKTLRLKFSNHMTK